MIYFARHPDTRLVKIGTTLDLAERLRQLRYDCDAKLELLAVTDGNYDEESRLHRRFAYLCVVGEWFEPGADLMDFIATECREWDGTAEVIKRRKGVLARMDKDVVEAAKRVAALKGITLLRYISDTMNPILDQVILDEARKICAGLEPQESPCP